MDKYRALRTDGKGWTYFVGNSTPRKSDFSYPIELYTMSKYTGRKDKNGMLIYSGDIIQKDKGTYKICFQYNTAMAYRKQEGYIPLEDLPQEQIQVIGNSYES